MISFDDSLDELGEDFGTFNSADFVNSKYEELNDQWAKILNSFTAANIPIPAEVNTEYKTWVRAYLAFKDAYNSITGLWNTTPFVSIYKNEWSRYERMFNALTNPRTVVRDSNNNERKTSELIHFGGPILPSELHKESPEGSGGTSLFGNINLNLGTFAVLGFAGFLAYNIFFRTREGRRKGL